MSVLFRLLFDPFSLFLQLYCTCDYHSFALPIFGKRLSIFALPLQSMSEATTPTTTKKLFDTIQNDVIGTDVGNRGMKSLIVEDDFLESCRTLANLKPLDTVLILSGFPCCVNESPPTETDGPSGCAAIAKVCLKLGYKVILITDECNKLVFDAAIEGLKKSSENISLQVFACSAGATPDDEKQRIKDLVDNASCIVACERAGPSSEEHCYTMRAISMNDKQLIAPGVNDIVKHNAGSKKAPFIAIGDGGNELGMGKVYESHIKDNPNIFNATKVGCVVSSDYLIAASVSNWGGYALCGGTAFLAAKKEGVTANFDEFFHQCYPSDQEESDIIHSIVEKGCRDGVSGKKEATVDGMPLETSLQCLRDIRKAILESSQ